MAKQIHHLGMTMGKGEHDEFHHNAPDLTPQQHQALMKRMGITKEQDEEWHRTHLTLGEQRARGLTRVDPSSIGGAFVRWCMKQGWLIQRGAECLASKDGVRELAERFEIVVEPVRRR
jgi:hypothetical protein